MNAGKVAEFITNWLKSYSESASARGFVVGISGGVDSATVSTLCAKTGLEVLVITMPIHQEKSQYQRAIEHMNWLMARFPNVKSKIVDLTEIFDSICKTYQADDSDPLVHLSLANTRSRLRMVTLYYYAQVNGLLVAGTGNKVEDFGVGFYTKYGDGGVDLSPIADLMKSEVYQLAKHLGINNDIITASPTDGLWYDHRTDEEQLGASYDQLEWAMKQWEAGKKPQDFSGDERRVMEIFQMHHLRNKHKMMPIPVCTIPESIRQA